MLHDEYVVLCCAGHYGAVTVCYSKDTGRQCAVKSVAKLKVSPPFLPFRGNCRHSSLLCVTCFARVRSPVRCSHVIFKC